MDSLQTTKTHTETHTIEAFLLCFTASIWKRIWRTLYVYLEIKKIGYNSSILLTSMKYNLFCRNGIVHNLINHIEKAIKQGFLMPNEYEKDEYLKRAIKLFGEAYKICSIGVDCLDAEQENVRDEMELEKRKRINKFLHDYAATVSNDSQSYIRKERQDILKDFENTKNFIDTFESWDIDINLYNSVDQSMNQPIDDTVLKIFNILLNSLKNRFLNS